MVALYEFVAQPNSGEISIKPNEVITGLYSEIYVSLGLMRYDLFDSDAARRRRGVVGRH